MAYNKQTWVPYDPDLSYDQNKANGGTASADRLNNMETGISNNDINKVTDNKNGTIQVNGSSITPADDSKVVHDNGNGTIQVNGTQVNPYNKLSDTIGGRNLLPGTSGTLQIVTNASGWNAGLPVITPVVTTIDSDTTYTARAWISPASHNTNLQIVWQDSSGNTRYGGGNNISAGTSGYSTWTGTITAGSTIQRVTIVFGASQSTPSGVSYKEMKLEQGSVATDWTPAPEDKVNVADMRKPASDVVGIDEVTTAITDAMDGTVKFKQLAEGTDLFSMLVTDGKSHFYACSSYGIAATLKNSPVTSAFSLELYPINIPQGVASNGVYNWDYTQMVLRPINSSTAWLASLSSDDSGNIIHTDWVQVATSTDLSTGLATKADDSKVAHLSGANNFDTTPTVNNNPLLLASSLPSDLARTGQSSNNDEDSAISDSNSNSGKIYYWTE